MPFLPRHRIALPLAGLAAVALTLTACSSGASQAVPADAETILVEDAKPTLVLVDENGEQSYQEDRETARESVEVPLSPSAVVTFDIATLDTLHTLGAGDAVVAIPDVTLPDYLSDYADLPKVGTLFEPDFEAVAELEPDLIVTAARSTGQYDELSEIATTIDLTGSYAGTFDPAAALERATQLGEIFEREDEVAEAAAETEELVDTITAEASGTALVLSVSGGEYGAFGEGSRFGYFFDGLGFTPAVAAADLPGTEGSPHGDTVTNEFILSAAPEWIFAFDRGAATGEGSTAEQTLDNALVDQTPAAQDDHVVLLPASELYIVINGLTAVQNVLETVHDAMQS
ncbi:ABC transporter substrate-binding protein [Microbacteriaceae bacterium VKM Ac-2855]|nr:ABC transporter substrate-binding protein [Microbacteriaceae bacterium VKM Ac-2855]